MREEENYSEMHSEITRIENPALEPTFPVAPQKRRIVLIAAVLGGQAQSPLDIKSYGVIMFIS